MNNSKLNMVICVYWSVCSIILGMNMPAKVERTVRRSGCELQLVGEPIGEFYNGVLTFGIIDILQDYDNLKSKKAIIPLLENFLLTVYGKF